MPRTNIYCGQCKKDIGDEESAWFSIVQIDLDFCSEGCYLEWKNGYNGQEYIDQEYKTKEEKEEETELIIDYKNLEGELDLSDFINLRWLTCIANRLISLNLSGCSQLEEIKCFGNQLTNIDISNCFNLVEFHCSNNLLTNLVLPNNPTNLKILNLDNNNFDFQDLSFLSGTTNLEDLSLESNDKAKINQSIYNKFTGSLDYYLNGMERLKRLDISNTDINEVNIDKLPNSLEEIKYSTKERPSCKLTEIVPQLEVYEWKDLHPDFNLSERKGWEKQGFDKKETKEWIQAGAEPKDQGFISYLKEVENVAPEWFLNNKEKKEYQKLREKCNDYGWCGKCHQPNTSQNWCQSCKKQEWKEDLTQLTGQQLINKFIQEYQLETNNLGNNLEWIPYEQFTNIECLAEGGFSMIYKAEWRKGDGNFWNVALKNLKDSQNISLDFLQEITNNKMFDSDGSVVECYGVSQDPETKNYVIIMCYMEYGNLRDYLQKNYEKLSFKDKLLKLWGIAFKLDSIHSQGIVHRDFHAGNILNGYEEDIDGYDDIACSIADLGISGPASEVDEGKKFGVIPYVAPEVLQGQSYTQGSDIYSFGIVAYEFLANAFPYYEQRGLSKEELKEKICRGLRPSIDKIKIPKLLKNLIKKCWDSNSKQRPSAEELGKTISDLTNEIEDKKRLNLPYQFQELESEYNHWSKNTPYQIHPTAVTTSELIKLFQNPDDNVLELELKKIEEEIEKPLTDKQKKRVNDFIQTRKEMTKNENDKEMKGKALALEDQLLEEKDLSQEEINIVIKYCERFVNKQEQLQANIETTTNK